MSPRIVGLTVLLLLLGAGPSAPAQDSAEAQALARQAQELAQGGKLEEAIAAIRKAIALDARQDLYLAMASDYELKAGKHADGLKHALEAIRLNDKVGPYYVLAAAHAIASQELEQARQLCEKVLEAGESRMGAGAVKDARTLLDKLGERTYTLFWNLDPARGRALRGTYVVAIPRTGLPYQNTTYEIKNVRSHRLVKGAANDLLHVVPQGMTPITLTTRVTVRPYSFRKELAGAGAAPLPAEARAYLAPSEVINPRSPVLTAAVAPLRGKDSVETARNILAWMKKNIEYKLERAPVTRLDFKTVEEILQRKHAECRGYALLFAALCRAAEIPARTVWGLTRLPAAANNPFGEIASHNWVEVYIAGAGWVPVDPQLPESLGLLPASCVQILVDPPRDPSALDTLPMLNLLYMNGDKLKFEESRE